MQLSEAILLGIGAVQNDKSVWLVTDHLHRCPRGCAIGTALYAAGSTNAGFVERGIEACERQWLWTAQSRSSVPISISREISLRHHSGESRESIAAWVATIEPQDEGTQDVLLLREVNSGV